MRMQIVRSQRSRRGAALVFTFFLMVSLVMLSGAFFRMVHQSGGELAATVDDRRAEHLAEAGLSEALTAIRGGGTGNVGNINTPALLGDGVFWVESTDIGGNRSDITVVAMAGQGRAALSATVVENEQAPLFNSVLNSRETLTVNADVMVDSYDSSLGTYASQATNTTNGHVHANMDGDVTSNMNIILNARATVFGDATPGPGHGVSFATGAYVSGTTTPAPEPFAFPPIDMPSTPSTGPMVVPNGAVATLAPGDHSFDYLTIDKDATLVVRGPAEILVDDFTGGKDANLVIDASAGPVTFYVRNKYTHTNGFEASPATGSPMAVAFMIESTDDIIFPSRSKVRGSYYAPEANITFTSENEAWGAFAGNRVDMSSTMKFHYDEKLRDYWQEETGQGEDPVQVLLWQTAEVTPSFLKTNRRDPFALLNLDRAALPSPADAWDI